MSVLTEIDFRSRLEATIEAKSLLKHPFYQAWNAGTLPRTALQDYAAQYYHFELAFPTFLSSLHSRMPKLADRQQLLGNLWDEENGPDNHVALWLRFCQALGLSLEDVETSTPQAATVTLIDTYRDLCGSGPVVQGLAALLAYESQVPAVAERKIAGLQSYYGIDDPAAVSFFTAHQGADLSHAAAERSLVMDNATTATDQDLVLLAADRALSGFWTFLDGVYAVQPA